MDYTASIAATTAAAVGGALLLWRYFQPAPAPPTALEAMRPGERACIRVKHAGGYEALAAHPLGDAGTTRGAASSLEGVPASDLVTVDVHFCGINYADICIRWGLYTSWNLFGGGNRSDQQTGAKGDVPGFEFAGVVAALPEGGDEAGGLAVGDEVVGVTLFGAYSSRVVVPRHQLFMRPAALSRQEAASLPSVAMTAWFAVRQQACPIPAGSWVLVHSAAGGVGSMLVQMCKLHGWKVCAVVGATHKVAAARKLGADTVIDKSAEPLWPAARRCAPGGYLAIFDANGVATLKNSYEQLAPCGKLIVYGFHSMLPRTGGVLSVLQWLRMARDWVLTPRFDPLTMVSSNKSVLAFNLSFLFSRRDLLDDAIGEIFGWIEAGKLAVPDVTVYGAGDVRLAHAALESGSTVGKLVLKMPQPHGNK